MRYPYKKWVARWSGFVVYSLLNYDPQTYERAQDDERNTDVLLCRIQGQGYS